MQIRTNGKRTGWLLAAACLILTAGCTSPSDDAAPAPAGNAPAPAPAAANPAAAAPAAGTDAAADELYVDVEAEPDEGAPPLAVQFTAEIEDNTGAVECEWDFKDGSPKQKGLNPMHVFNAVEDYEVYVLCKDSAGVEGEAEIDIFVEEE